MYYSNRFVLNQYDVRKWLYNTAVFFAPALLVYLLVLRTGGTQQEAIIALKLWGINTTIDLLRKFISEK